MRIITAIFMLISLTACYGNKAKKVRSHHEHYKNHDHKKHKHKGYKPSLKSQKVPTSEFPHEEILQDIGASNGL